MDEEIDRGLAGGWDSGHVGAGEEGAVSDALKVAEERYLAANRDRSRLEAERNAAIKAKTVPLLDEVDRIKSEVHGEFNPKIEEAHGHAFEAKREYDDLRAETALAENAAVLGRKYIQWDTPRFCSSPFHKTGKAGIVAVWRRDSPSPDNVQCLPAVGSLYLRLLNKDGSESKRFERHWQHLGWRPEGVDPNAAESQP